MAGPKRLNGTDSRDVRSLVERSSMGWQYKPIPAGQKREEAARELLELPLMWEKAVRESAENLEKFRISKYSVQACRMQGMPGSRGIRRSPQEMKAEMEEKLVRKLRRAEMCRDEAVAIVEEAISTVESPKAKEVLRLVCSEGLSATEAGRRLGITDRQVRRLKLIGYREMSLPESGEEKLAAC